ncbi:uncharacterized protein DUF1460 [Algoriphagus boseongensis]|uniref:Uncharacterized protein DUF1460 n=1 Tax=Algoriphagus boseongensis TaxID=1442587 RepID=A0A4R6T470_9BACT|nr:N-acetylmuramoyl-L-alanine amidase-like domain-containing protein [Algoriphagus boseongensis]TDQ16572.1 uncharacterized protein DUF1460 [Algoriphagus boseongensis]
MKKFLGFYLLFLLFGTLSAQTVCTPESRAKLENALAKLKSESDKTQSPNEWIVETGQWFLETPYVEKTLEIPGPEQLVIDFQGVDCTTYLESVVTLARLAEKKEFSMEDFEIELELLRYRKGKNEGYQSRLHYFSDWIYENQEKGILEDITASIDGEVYENHPSFMTENPQFYPQLSEQKNVEKLKQVEKEISARKYYYIPKAKIKDIENQIQSGDLIAITTSISNLDMVHVGFAFQKNGRIHLMHASSKNKEVEISSLPLHEYLAGNKSQSGIMVARITGK